MKYLAVLALAFNCLTFVNAHSWVDDLRVTGGAGPIDGTLGYIRGYRGHLDAVSSYRIDTPQQCIYMDTQRTPNQPDPKYPKLKASPGAEITASWLENGHTTNDTPENNAPEYNSGKVYMYGSTEPPANLTLAGILAWKPDEGPNRFLATFPFDDGYCAEPGSESKPRGAPRWASGGGGPCMGKFNLPEDLNSGTTYTVYWVWDFSGKAPHHFEWYSSVMDIDIIANLGDGYDREGGDKYYDQQESGNENSDQKNNSTLPLLRRSAKFRARLW